MLVGDVSLLNKHLSQTSWAHRPPYFLEPAAKKLHHEKDQRHSTDNFILDPQRSLFLNECWLAGEC